jgi:hypothetical protein
MPVALAALAELVAAAAEEELDSFFIMASSPSSFSITSSPSSFSIASPSSLFIMASAEDVEEEVAAPFCCGVAGEQPTNTKAAAKAANTGRNKRLCFARETTEDMERKGEENNGGQYASRQRTIQSDG